MHHILETQNLSYWVDGKADKHILKNISFKLLQEKSLTIIGPNGSGKTTLLKIILRLLNTKNLKGDILLNEKPIDTFSYRDLGQLVAYVPQRPVLPPQMRLFDYVLLGRTSHIHLFGNESFEDIEIVKEVLQDLEMEWAAERRLNTLSGGESQLAVIARALASKAPLLLLDEPTASLDLGHSHKLCKIIYELPAKCNVSIVTTMHDLQLAHHFAEDTILLHNGEICERGSATQVITGDNLYKYYDADPNITAF